MKAIKKFVSKSAARASRLGIPYRFGVIGATFIVLVWGAAGLYAWNYLENQRESEVALSERKIEDLDKAIARLETEKTERERLEEEERRAKEVADAEEQKKAEEEARGAATSNQGTASTATCNASSSHNSPSSIDVMVNKKHCLQPLSFTPADLVASHGATISAKAVADFNRMYADAAAAGQPFSVSSSYRSYGTQVSTYNYWVSVNGQAGADTVSARPGFSEHQTGLAIDVGANGCNLSCFGGTTQYQWFQNNAANYGFIQRYYSGYEHITGYSSEEWHYRYVGVATAQDMKARGIKTLEQYWGMEGGNYR